ncbi:hypothetical protein STEG23_001569, partial [Scotinomys teguina]
MSCTNSKGTVLSYNPHPETSQAISQAVGWLLSTPHGTMSSLRNTFLGLFLPHNSATYVCALTGSLGYFTKLLNETDFSGQKRGFFVIQDQQCGCEIVNSEKNYN